MKRCVAIPSDTLEIKNGIIFINGKKSIMPYRAKPIFNYSVYNQNGISTSKLSSSGIKIQRKFRIRDITQQKLNQMRPYILRIMDNNPNNFTIITDFKGIPYDVRSSGRIVMTEITEKEMDVFLTEQEAEILKKSRLVDSITRNFNKIKSYNTQFFPNDIRFNWNEDNFGPIIIPKKGEKKTLIESRILKNIFMLNSSPSFLQINETSIEEFIQLHRIFSFLDHLPFYRNHSYLMAWQAYIRLHLVSILLTCTWSAHPQSTCEIPSIQLQCIRVC